MAALPPTLGTAIVALAQQCDGAVDRDGKGFNGADAAFGRSMALLASQRPSQLWSYKQRSSVWLMLQKYRGQLAALGIDLSLIPEPVEQPFVEAVQPPTPREIVGLGSNVTTSFKRAMLEPELVAEVEDEAARAFSSLAILGPDGVIAGKLPGYESRQAQLDLAAAIEKAIDQAGHIVAEAGTGTGKSLGYLVPAILSGKRTIVSTADKALQTQIVAKDIPFLQSVMPHPFTAVLLKGRGNYVCKQHLDKATTQAALPGLEAGFTSPETGGLLAQVAAWEATTTDGDLEAAPFQLNAEARDLVTADSDSCIGKKCPFIATCYSERVKLAARGADVVVVNHALLMRDLELRSQGPSQGVVPAPQVIVLDEAHHLEDIATDQFGAEVTKARWDRISRRILGMAKDNDDLKLRMDAIEGSMRALFSSLAFRFETNSNFPPSNLNLGDEMSLAGGLLVQLDDLRSYVRESTPVDLEEAERESWRKLSEQLERLINNLRGALNPDGMEGYVRYMEPIKYFGPSVKLHVKPIEVADLLRSRLWRMRYYGGRTEDDEENEDEGTPVTVVATSATIATADGMAPWKARVGCDHSDDLVVGSPFDYPRMSLLYLPPNGGELDPSQFRQEGSYEYTKRLAGEIEALIMASSGRAFVLFTSNKTLDEVYKMISPRLANSYLVLRQGESSRPELTRRFKEDGQAVLFATKSYWEGVDIAGEALSLVIIDKLPFIPPDDPIFEAKKDALTRRTGDKWAWWNQLALPGATIALKQGFGRLIRTKTDRGVVAILDGRLTKKSYGKAIISALPPAIQTSSKEAVRAFFGAGS